MNWRGNIKNYGDFFNKLTFKLYDFGAATAALTTKKWLHISLLFFLCLNCSDEDMGYEPTPESLDIPQIFSENIRPI